MPCFDGIGQHALCLFSAGEDEYYPRGFWYSKSFVRNKEILWPKKALSEKVLLGFLSYLYREVLIRVLFSRSFGNLLSFVRVIVWVRFMQRPNFRQVRGTFVEVRLCKLFGLRLYMLGSGWWEGRGDWPRIQEGADAQQDVVDCMPQSRSKVIRHHRRRHHRHYYHHLSRWPEVQGWSCLNTFLGILFWTTWYFSHSLSSNHDSCPKPANNRHAPWLPSACLGNLRCSLIPKGFKT